LQFITEWRRLGLPFEGGKILIAVSGGADSCALASVVAEMTARKKLGNTFTVAHFDHGLRGEESEGDARFVEDLSSRLGFGFVEGRAKKGVFGSKSNLEEKARNARYQFLAHTASKIEASAVLTAHTLNDQAETFLLNLIRGSGMTGLGGMPCERPLEGTDGSVLLVRPFLRWALRADTVAYAEECGITARRDAMNDDISFTRVRIRKEIIPLLEEINPKIVQTLASTAEGISAESDAARARREPDGRGSNSEGSHSLRISDLRELSEGGRNLAVREWLKEQRGDLRRIGRKHHDAIIAMALSEKSGKTVEVPGGGRVTRSSGRLRFEKVKVEK